MLAQFSQHRSDGMPECVPADPGNPKLIECRSDLSFQDCRQVESFSTTVESRREHEIRSLGAMTLRLPLQQSLLQCRMHRKRFRRGFCLRALQNAATSPVVGTLAETREQAAHSRDSAKSVISPVRAIF